MISSRRDSCDHRCAYDFFWGHYSVGTRLQLINWSRMDTDSLLRSESPPQTDSGINSYQHVAGPIGDQVTIHHNYNSIHSDPLTASQQSVQCAVYKRRWYILFIFTCMSFMQGAMPNVWTVIAQSVEPAFGWSDATISLMMNWVYVTYLIAMGPAAWIIDNKG